MNTENPRGFVRNVKKAGHQISDCIFNYSDSMYKYSDADSSVFDAAA